MTDKLLITDADEACRSSEISVDFSIECWNCSDSVIYIFSFYYMLWKKPAELQLLKQIWLWSSSVIKIVKMKYNRIDIKWQHVSTSFKIYLEMLSYLYITFMIFYYNTISLKGTFFLVLVKELYQTEYYSLHVMQLIRIFLFSTPCGVGSLLCMRNINCKPHWLAICCLSRIYFFLDRQFRS